LAFVKGKVTIERGQHYLFPSKEVINVPPNLSAQLRRHSHEGIEGTSHDAGFIDQGFKGDMVFEISPEEVSRVVLSEGMPLSRLDFFRTSQIPDKLYGEEIGSSYRGQFGPRHSNHFKSFDFAMAAQNYAKLNRNVLVQDTNLLLRNRRIKEGFESIDSETESKLFEDIKNGFFSSRYDCEDDELILQFIPYVIIFGEDSRGNPSVFSYVRSSKIEDYGDKRLFGKHSIGVGGHVSEEDGPDYIKRCLEREMDEEVNIHGNFSQPRLTGTLMAYDKPIDRVHLGLIYATHTKGMVSPKERSLVSGEMVSINEIRDGYHENAETETWTRILIPHLNEIYELSK